MREATSVLVAGSLIALGLSGRIDAQSPPARNAQAVASAAAEGSFDAPQFLDRYCVSCHNQRLRTAGLALDTLDVTTVGAQPDTWERALAKVRAGMMPPPAGRKPDAEARAGFVTYSGHALDAAANAHPDPGRTDALHRLNRTEYRNAIRDLFDLDVDVAALLPPEDTHANGFANIAEALGVSPALIDRYLSAASKVSAMAAGMPPSQATSAVYTVSPLVDQRGYLGEDLPLGTRGGVSVKHTFPADGEYEVRVGLQKNYVDYVRGLGESHQVEIRVDGSLVKRFTLGGEALGGFGRFPAPASYAGDIQGDEEWERYVLNGDTALKVRFAAKAGPHVVTAAFPLKRVEPEGVRPSKPREGGHAFAVDDMPEGYSGVERVVIGGPYETAPRSTDLSRLDPTRKRVFTCVPSGASSGAANDDECAARILNGLARRAYRRPLQQQDRDTLLDFYREGRRGGFQSGIQRGIERILSDPEFLFRIERDPAGATSGQIYNISDLELASRLSFFLWSSIPDEELLGLAERKQLANTAVLEQQVRRMMADRRSSALIENFIGDWLELKNLQGIAPDTLLYPEFDENLRTAFKRETELFVDSQIRDDRSVVELLTANYTFLNEQLARHYGIDNIVGTRFRKVVLQDPRRGGILGQGSILAVTAYPNRTSPVIRGKFILQNILGTPPSPPPPNVPALPERGEGGRPASVRERLEVHRRSPVCAVCHAPMDPLGFALENFDPIGRWRTHDGLSAVDPVGTLPTGEGFDGPATLRVSLASEPERFVGTVTEKLLAYGLGRALDAHDYPTVRGIAREAAQSNYRWSAIIVGVTRSQPFTMRRAQ